MLNQIFSRLSLSVFSMYTNSEQISHLHLLLVKEHGGEREVQQRVENIVGVWDVRSEKTEMDSSVSKKFLWF